MVPPKAIPGESEEDFLRRKREYWRVKKKEQRARKAIREKGVSPGGTPNHLRSILPAQDLHTQVKAAQVFIKTELYILNCEEPIRLMMNDESALLQT